MTVTDAACREARANWETEAASALEMPSSTYSDTPSLERIAVLALVLPGFERLLGEARAIVLRLTTLAPDTDGRYPLVPSAEIAMGFLAEPLTLRTDDAPAGLLEEMGWVASKRCSFELLER